MDIKELLLKKIDEAKKERLVEELRLLHRILKNKREAIANLKEMFDITLTDELISFIEKLDLSKYDLVIEINSLGHVGIGTTNPNQEVFYIE